MWIALSMGLAACSLGLTAWWLARPYAQLGSAHQSGKHWLLRLVWPWVQALAGLCGPVMSWHWRARLERLLQQAGVASEWTPAHFAASQLLAALLAAAATGVMLHGILGPTAKFCASLGVATLAAAWPWQHLRERIQRRKRDMLREFPFMLDMITLCVEAGLNFHGALQQAGRHGPAGPLREELLYVLADIRAGTARQQALAAWAERCDLVPLHHFVAAVAQAEHSGMSLGSVLRAQADQRRSERFQQAEKLALEAPVKMMFPLVFCIFPCSFLVIAFPLAIQFLSLWES